MINEYAWHNLFAHQLFIRPTEEELLDHEAGLRLFLHLISKQIQQLTEQNQKHLSSFLLKNVPFLIGGTEYAGEIKKSIFSIMNYLIT